MRALLALLLAAMGCDLQRETLFDERLEETSFGTVSVAAPRDALTFARTRGGAPFLVTSYQDSVVTGVDLSRALGRPVSDPIEVYLAEGHGRLQTLAETAARDVSVSADELGTPVDLGRHHPAAGTNFPEHADEVDVEDGPFLFPKLVEPTHSRATVSVATRLLDYETEVAWVTLTEVPPGQRAEQVGLILLDDFTDRAVLLRGVNTADVASGEGFADGKSFPGALPVGDLFVIPVDHRAFVDRLTLRLWVNGELRQRAALSTIIWDYDRLVQETWARQSRPFTYQGSPVTLLPGEAWPARTMLLSGTPAGVVYTSVTAEHRASGFFDFLLGGWGQSIPTHAIEAYINDARAAGIYLQPGDVVSIHVELMGTLRTEVVR